MRRFLTAFGGLMLLVTTAVAEDAVRATPNAPILIWITSKDSKSVEAMELAIMEELAKHQIEGMRSSRIFPDGVPAADQAIAKMQKSGAGRLMVLRRISSISWETPAKSETLSSLRSFLDHSSQILNSKNPVDTASGPIAVPNTYGNTEMEVNKGEALLFDLSTEKLVGRVDTQVKSPKDLPVHKYYKLVAEKAVASLAHAQQIPPQRSSRSPMRLRRLRRSELPVNTRRLARYLIGKTLVHDIPQGRMSGRIVETEAYVVGDAAAHSFRGKTARNQSLFLEHGHAYVYFIYGNWFAINVAGEREGVGAGVLIRALEPLDGIHLMRRRRRGASLHELARGPGRLATALGIDRRYDGIDLCAPGPIWLGTPVKLPGRLGRSVRIGITKEAHRLLRFFERGNPCVSGPKKYHA